MEDRNDSGGVPSGSNMTTGIKDGGRSEGSAATMECSTSEQAMVRVETLTMTTED